LKVDEQNGMLKGFQIRLWIINIHRHENNIILKGKCRKSVASRKVWKRKQN